MTTPDPHKPDSIMEQATKRVEAAARRSADAKQWEALVQRLALALNCMPSSFVDGNEHLLRAIAALLAERDAAVSAIVAFCAGQDGAVDAWKEQPHIAPLFDIAKAMEGQS